MISFWTQKITRIRPSTKTLRDQEVPDWDNVSSLVIEGCSVQPTSTALSIDGRVLGVTDGLTVYAPINSDIKAGDKVIYPATDTGEPYMIDGTPLIWPSASGQLDHMQINLKRWQG